jgi:hypothetical protein
MRLAVLVTLACVGCGYPDFAFRAQGDAAPSDAIVLDDTSVPETAEDDANADASSDDTSVGPDTTVAEVLPDVAIDTAPVSPCKTAHLFCADFDGSSDVKTGWSSNYVVGGGTIGVDPAAMTKPNAFVATLPDGMTTASALLAYDFTAKSTSAPLRLDADVRLSAASYGTGTENVILFKVQRGTSGSGIGLTLAETGFRLFATGSSTTAYDVPKAVKADTWYHVRIECLLDPTNGWFKVYVDDTTTPLLSKTGVSTIDTPDTGQQMIAGLYGWMSSHALSVRFDDVTLDYVP